MGYIIKLYDLIAREGEKKNERERERERKRERERGGIFSEKNEEALMQTALSIIH